MAGVRSGAFWFALLAIAILAAVAVVIAMRDAGGIS